MEALQAVNEGDLYGRPAPEERQYALILVAGGDKAYNCWDTLEDTVDDPKKVDQVWNTFEKSFEQSTSFWHFRDAYLGDFKQDPTESAADLDLCIKQTVRGCQWLKTTEEEQMIDLLYHATIFYDERSQNTVLLASTQAVYKAPHSTVQDTQTVRRGS